MTLLVLLSEHRHRAAPSPGAAGGTGAFSPPPSAPWRLFFSYDGSGRFDPTDIGGRGSCYLAEDPLGAWVESFRTVMTIAEVDVDERVLSSMTLNRPLKVADLTRRLAAGVTAAVTAGPDYRDAQRLASELQGNADGVRWRLRYDLGQSLIGVALFGDAGSQPAASSLPTQTEAIPRELVREAEDAFGYRVAPLP